MSSAASSTRVAERDVGERDAEQHEHRDLGQRGELLAERAHRLGLREVARVAEHETEQVDRHEAAAVSEIADAEGHERAGEDRQRRGERERRHARAEQAPRDQAEDRARRRCR